jgi:glycerol-3-phosphate dehydrogenase (NAD(P)+)
MRAVVVGCGSWGTAFAWLLKERGHEVTLVCRDPAQARAIRETGRNPRYSTTADLVGVAAVLHEEAPYEDADVIVVAVPSRVFHEVVETISGTAPILSLTKGLDPTTGERLSRAVTGRAYALLSGPNMAEEVIDGLPTAAVIASEDAELAARLQHAINSPTFRIYLNDDLLGVELCAAAKNVIALAAGGVDGLGLGDNAKAALITRGLAEMRRLGEAAGAAADTFAGMAGMGDLIVTCWHPSGGADRPRRLPRGGRGGDRTGRRRPDDGARAPAALAPPRRRAADHRRRLRGARRRYSDGTGLKADAARADGGMR